MFTKYINSTKCSRKLVTLIRNFSLINIHSSKTELHDSLLGMLACYGCMNFIQVNKGILTRTVTKSLQGQGISIITGKELCKYDDKINQRETYFSVFFKVITENGKFVNGFHFKSARSSAT
jgi:hypothetical protein